MHVCPYCGIDFTKTDIIVKGGFVIDPRNKFVMYNGEPVENVRTAHIHILYSLAKAEPMPLSRHALLNRISDAENLNVLSVQMNHLRNHLIKAGVPIPFETVREQGYRWVAC